MSFIFLDAHPRKYHLSLNDFSTSMIKPPLSASVYAKRHFEIANMPENQGKKFSGLGHRLIGIVEYLPILGLVAGIAERIIAFVFHQAKIFLSKFKSEVGVTTSNLTANTLPANPLTLNTSSAQPELQEHVEDEKSDSPPKDNLPNKPELIPEDNQPPEPVVKDAGLHSDKVKDEPELKEMFPQPTPVITKKPIFDIHSEYRLKIESQIQNELIKATAICKEIQNCELELITMNRELNTIFKGNCESTYNKFSFEDIGPYRFYDSTNIPDGLETPYDQNFNKNTFKGNLFHTFRYSKNKPARFILENEYELLSKKKKGALLDESIKDKHLLFVLRGKGFTIPQKQDWTERNNTYRFTTTWNGDGEIPNLSINRVMENSKYYKAPIINLNCDIRSKEEQISELKKRLTRALAYENNFSSFYKNSYKVFSPDYKIKIGGKEFPVSKKLLASISDYFKASFEFDNSSESTQIKLEILTPETFELILGYYTKAEGFDINKLSIDQVFDVIHASTFFQMDILQFESIDLLVKYMKDRENVIDFDMIMRYAMLAIDLQDKVGPHFCEFFKYINLDYLVSDENKFFEFAYALHELNEKELNESIIRQIRKRFFNADSIHNVITFAQSTNNAELLESASGFSLAL